MISKTFFKSSFIYSVVGALPYASGVILIPFFAARLTPEQFGINELYLTFMYFVQILATFGLDTYIGINYFEHKDNKQRLREFIGTILMVLIVLGFLVVFLLSLAGPSIFKLVFSQSSLMSFYPYGMITVLSAFFNGIFKSYSSLLINQQRPNRFLWLNLSNFLVTVAGTIILLYLFPYTLLGPVLGRLIPAFISCGITVYLIVKEFGFAYRRTYLKGIVDFCLPMVVYAIMVWIVTYIDRYIINSLMKDTMYVAIFSFAVKIALMIDIVQIGLSNTIHPKVYNIWKDGNLNRSTVEVNRYYNGFTALTLLMIPVITIVIPLLVPLIVKNPVYYQSFAFLPILTLGYVTRGWYFLFLAPLFYFKKTKVLPRILFFSALFQVVSGYLLIRSFGLMGAVIASSLNKPVQAFFIYMESRKVFHFSFNKWKIIYLPVIYIIVVLASEFFVNDQNRLLIGTGRFFVACGLVWFVYRNEIMPLIVKWFRP